MKKIIIPSPAKDNLTDQFIALYQALLEIERKAEITFDFSQLNKAYPLTTLPLFVFAHDHKNMIDLSPIAELHMPITYFSNTPGIKTRNNLMNNFVEKLYKIMGEVESTKNAIFYPISELITNIFEHSHKEEGWAFGQLDAEKKHLDICIVDSGRGLKESYVQEKKLKLSDAEAIGQAMIGNSTKPGNDRGCGIRTSKKLVCEGLKGSFLILSGKAALITEYKHEQLIELDKPIWNGVVLAYRIPLPKGPINIYPYVE